MADGALHVVFGAGQVGLQLVARLLQAGQRVRIARRSGAPAPEGVEVARGDATDPAFCAEATRGAAAAYHCMNPPYSAKVWAEVLPRFASNLVEAAGRAGARLVVLDNLYALGNTGGQPMDEDTPFAPCSRKGEVRARVAATLADAHRRGAARVVVARASDFYGPGGEQTYFGAQLWPTVLRGGAGLFPANPDTPHTYHFIPDVAAGLAALGLADADVEGRSFMLPCAPAETTRALLARMSRALGRELRIRRLPRAALAVLGLAVPILREVAEMTYQWDQAFVVDDRRFRARFPDVRPTDTDAGARETVAWALGRFGEGRQARAS
jgi:nucleoside-diphosphate-sugar epimerase